MHSVRRGIWRVFMVALALAGPVASAAEPEAASVPSDEERIERIERGLRPVNPIAGEDGWTLSERMEHYGVPGVGIAVIENGELAWFRVYGKSDRETGTPVTTETLFQAGSISKPVAAFGALEMVQQEQLDLDRDVNEKLKSWKIPENELTSKQPVTLTHLTSHTGGLTVHGFPGYAVGAEVPALVQVLDGEKPANTAAIRVDKLPGESWRYSGGGYTVMQQMMIDVAGKPFPELMHEIVLGPIGMKQSTYLQPLPADRLKHAAAGVLPDGKAVSGKRHTYPEMAAAGLWTTAGDLALFAVEVQKALKGQSEVLSKEMAEKMVEPVVPSFGRGFALETRQDTPYFSHGGWDEGFCAQLTARRDGGQGVAVMINSNHPAFIDEVIVAVALEYGWPGYQEHQRVPLQAEKIESFSGRYRYNAEQSFRIFVEEDRLFLQYTGSPREEMVPIGDDRFVRRERPTPIRFTLEEGRPRFNFELGDGGFQSHEQLGADEKLAREILAEGPFDAALAAYRKLMEAGDDAAAEGYLNNVGLDLVGESNHELGIALLKINCELYPKSANTWDSVGYAYREAGQTEEAIRYYEKSLEVDPDFPSAVEALAELRPKP